MYTLRVILQTVDDVVERKIVRFLVPTPPPPPRPMALLLWGDHTIAS